MIQNLIEAATSFFNGGSPGAPINDRKINGFHWYEFTQLIGVIHGAPIYNWFLGPTPIFGDSFLVIYMGGLLGWRRIHENMFHPFFWMNIRSPPTSVLANTSQGSSPKKS